MKQETEDSMLCYTPLSNGDMKLDMIVNSSELPIKRPSNQKDDPIPTKHVKQYNNFEYNEVEQKSIFNYFNFIGKARKELKGLFQSSPQIKNKACQYKNWPAVALYLREQLNMNQRYKIEDLNNQKIMIDNAINFFKKAHQDTQPIEPTKKEETIQPVGDWKIEFNKACDKVLSLSSEQKQSVKSLILNMKQCFNKTKE